MICHSCINIPFFPKTFWNILSLVMRQFTITHQNRTLQPGNGGSPRTRKFNVVLPIDKVMVTVFCDQKGVLVDFLEAGVTMSTATLEHLVHYVQCNIGTFRTAITVLGC